MKLLIQILFLLSVNNLIGQIAVHCDTTVVFNGDVKFEFEKWKGSGTKILKTAKGLTLDIRTGDTVHQLYGALYDVDGVNIKIIPRWEIINIDTNEFISSSKTVTYKNCITTIPIQNIQSLKYDANYNIIPASIGWASLFSALIVAPVVSIDRNSPNNFNTKRYQSILFSSLIGAGAGFACYYIINGGKNKFKLKPKLINTYL